MKRKTRFLGNRVRISLIFLLCAIVFIFWRAESFSQQNLNQVIEKIKLEYADVSHISTKELSSWLKDPTKEPPLLIDSRSKEEYDISHLEGARLLESRGEIKRVLKGIDSSKPIVMYCSVGYRSAVLARELRSQGYTNVSNLEGSIFAWANEGRAVFRYDMIVQEVHPYNKGWGKFLDQVYHPTN